MTRRIFNAPTTIASGSLTASITKAALVAGVIIGLSACSGTEEVIEEAVVETESPDSTEGAEGEFLPADGAEGDEAPDALADADVVDTESDDAEADDPATADELDSEENAEPESNPIGIDSPPAPPGAPDGYAIFSDGRLYLRGVLPNQEIADTLVASVERIVGPGNAIDETIIDPDVAFDADEEKPVYIAETVLFETGSTEIHPDFLPLLSLTPVLLITQPNATLEIVGYTDDVGDDATNLALSQARVDAVRDWVIAQGGDGDRIIATGAGESNPVADNSTEESRALNRRVEFLITGFDFGI